MIQRKETGRRYLAGLVMAGALIHLGAIGYAAAEQRNALPGFLVAGAAPAAIAIFLGQRAWTTRDDGSALYAAGGLVVLLIGAVLARLTVLE
jgi:fructose-specific phosphotransferase system IIC component